MSGAAAWLVGHPLARIVVTLVVGALILRFTARAVRLVLTILLVGVLAWLIWQGFLSPDALAESTALAGLIA